MCFLCWDYFCIKIFEVIMFVETGHARLYQTYYTRVWVLIFSSSSPPPFSSAQFIRKDYFSFSVSALSIFKEEKLLACGIVCGTLLGNKTYGNLSLCSVYFYFINLKLIKNFKLKISNLVLLSPFIGFGIYCLYLWKTVGDPFFSSMFNPCLALTDQPI